MIALDNAIHGRINGDGTVTALLSMFKGQRAIFVGDLLPPGVVPPYISSPPSFADAPNDAKNAIGRAISRDIGCYTLATGNTTTVDAIAERVRELFHRHPLVISGFATMIASASGPVVAPTDKTLYGRIVTVSWTIWKT